MEHNQEMAEINPQKDFKINMPPHIEIEIIKGKKIKVPKYLLDNLKTEGVIL